MKILCTHVVYTLHCISSYSATPLIFTKYQYSLPIINTIHHNYPYSFSHFHHTSPILFFPLIPFLLLPATALPSSPLMSHPATFRAMGSFTHQHTPSLIIRHHHLPPVIYLQQPKKHPLLHLTHTARRQVAQFHILYSRPYQSPALMPHCPHHIPYLVPLTLTQHYL